MGWKEQGRSRLPSSFFLPAREADVFGRTERPAAAGAEKESSRFLPADEVYYISNKQVSRRAKILLQNRQIGTPLTPFCGFSKAVLFDKCRCFFEFRHFCPSVCKI